MQKKREREMLPFILNGYFIYPNKMEGKYKRVTFVEIVFFSLTSLPLCFRGRKLRALMITFRSSVLFERTTKGEISQYSLKWELAWFSR